MSQSLAFFLEQGKKTIGFFEARLLLQFLTGKTAAQILSFGDSIFLNQQQEQFWKSAIVRRQKGEPFFYILGEIDFAGLNFEISPDVLIPRPETELLLFKAIDFIQQNSIVNLLDLGTGSGILAICLKKRFPFLQVWASDFSQNALNIAQKNAKKNAVEIHFLKSNWFENIPHSFDLIVSNPPYIAENDPHLNNLQFEPAHALIAQENGTLDLSTIIQNAPLHLNHNGILLLEHGHNQGDFCQKKLKENGFVHIFTQNDLAQLPRISGGIKIPYPLHQGIKP